MTTTVDVRELAFDRTAGREIRQPGGGRRWLTRYLIPGVILFGFVAVMGWSVRDRFQTSTAVTVMPVLASRADVQIADSPLFTSAGWIEPRPTPVIVSALAEGIVEKLFVIEGQEVQPGEPLARLIDADAKLALRDARSMLAIRKAERESADASVVAARVLLREPLERQTMLAEAQSQLAKVETDLARLPFQIKSAEARREFARRDWESKIMSQGVTPEIALARAKSELDASEELLKELNSQTQTLARERDAHARRRDAFQRQLELKVQEIRLLGEAEANVKLADARIQQAEIAVETAQLRLDRMTIRAPINGRVMALVTRPGGKVMGQSATSAHDASTVVTLYQPDQLQVRADVRLDNVPSVLIGQTVRIETPAAVVPLMGRVIAITAITDIQKNTLQVKVGIDAPPPVLKPDMLVQLTFLAPPQPKGVNEGSPLRLLVPKTLVQIEGSTGVIWVADLVRSVAVRRSITVGGSSGSDLVEVREGLGIGDRLIVAGRDGLVEGQRIQVSGEDQSMGMSSVSEPTIHAHPRLR